MDIETFLTPGLGDMSYLVASQGEAALVDPQRDVQRFLDVAEQRGWRIKWVLETHVHNDYLSGGLEARAATGAEIVAPARGHYRFAHRAADEGDAIVVGDLAIVGMATPGHTPEHLAWQVVRRGETIPVAVLTGGSLLVGSAGRSDLLGPAQMPALAARQFESLRRLAALPDDVRVLPTHGAGSFCVAGPASAERMSTIGHERRTNPYLQIADADSFRPFAAERLGRYPAYYAHMAGINRQGPSLRGIGAPPPALTAGVLAQLIDAGAYVIDARDRQSFADGHVPGSIHVEPTDSFGVWVGAVTPFDAPVVLVTAEARDDTLKELTVQLWRVGYGRVLGYLDGGVDAWVSSGRELASHATISSALLVDELATADGSAVLDVRQPTEWREGTIPGSRTIFAGDLRGRIAELPHDRTWTVICRSGARASIAASVLAAAGHRVRVVTEGGVPDYLERIEERARVAIAVD